MAENRYALSAEDVRLLREMADEYRRRRPYPPTRSPREPDPTAPEVYAARTPPSGIPALEEYTGTSPDEPGSAICQIYNLRGSGGATTGTTDDTYALYKVTGVTRRVFNLTHRTIAGNAWVIVWRTKYGAWVTQSDADEAIVDTGTGTGTDQDPDDFVGGGACTDILRAGPNDCLLASGPDDQSVYLTNTGAGTWASTDEMAYPDSTSGASGTLMAQFNTNTGLLDLFLDGMRLLNCGNGCYSGGWMTGHVPAGSSSANCDEEVFTVCLSCSCCPIEGWDGEGWYCVQDFGAVGTGTSDCSPLYLTEADRCDETITICSGPYATEAEAEAVCDDTGTGSGTGTVPIGCSSLCETVSRTLEFEAFEGTGGSAWTGSLGSFLLTYDAANNWWRGSGNLTRSGYGTVAVQVIAVIGGDYGQAGGTCIGSPVGEGCAWSIWTSTDDFSAVCGGPDPVEAGPDGLSNCDPFAGGMATFADAGNWFAGDPFSYTIREV